MLLMVTWTPAYLLDRIRVGDKQQLYCDFSLSDNAVFAFFVIVAGYHIPSFVMIFCYAKVYIAVRKARKTVTPSTIVIAVNPASTSTNKDTKTVEETSRDVKLPTETIPNPIASISRLLSVTPSPTMLGHGCEKVETCRREMKVFRSLSYIVTAYIVLWTPCHIVVDVLCFEPSLVSDDLYSYVSALCYINSALNPLLYAASNDQMRRAIRRIFCCGSRRR